MIIVARNRRAGIIAGQGRRPGNAPPMPSPVKKRRALSTDSEPATALSNEATPKIKRLAINSGRRPKRSPIGPADNAPTMMPMLDHKNAMVNAGGGRCHKWISDGTAQPIELMS